MAARHDCAYKLQLNCNREKMVAEGSSLQDVPVHRLNVQVESRRYENQGA